jgi:structural maintenance of chromosome 4
MEKLEAELEELRRKTGKIEQCIKDLQGKILEVGGVRLRTQQAKVKDLKAMVEHANNRLTKAEVGRAKAERDTSKHDKTLQKAIAELEVLEGELSDLEGKVNGNSSETEAMKDTVDQARMALEEQKDRLQDIQERRKEKLKIMNVFQLKQVRILGSPPTCHFNSLLDHPSTNSNLQTELKQQREKAEAALAQSAANVRHWTEKQSSLKLNVIEDE